MLIAVNYAIPSISISLLTSQPTKTHSKEDGTIVFRISEKRTLSCLLIPKYAIILNKSFSSYNLKGLLLQLT
jgi:hypothetical protein